MYLLSIICILTSVVSTYYYLKIISYIFFNKILQITQIINPKLLIIIKFQATEFFSYIPLYLSYSITNVKNIYSEIHNLNLKLYFLFSYIILIFTLIIVLSLTNITLINLYLDVIIRSLFYV
jgi:hypothetical protein